MIKRLSHGLDVSYNFTWSKTLDNGIEADIENDIFNRGTNKFLSGSDRPLVSNININYTVPAAPWAGNKILKYVLSDWQTGALLTYASGTPILVPASTNQLNTSYFLPTASYLNRVPGVPLFLQDLNCHCFDPTKTLVLNPAAWVAPAPGTYGTSAAYYNDYRSQRHPTENFNIGRTFRIRESMSFSVRAEFVNIFNRTVLPTPSATHSADGGDLLRVGQQRPHTAPAAPALRTLQASALSKRPPSPPGSGQARSSLASVSRAQSVLL